MESIQREKATRRKERARKPSPSVLNRQSASNSPTTSGRSSGEISRPSKYSTSLGSKIPQRTKTVPPGIERRTLVLDTDSSVPSPFVKSPQAAIENHTARFSSWYERKML